MPVGVTVVVITQTLRINPCIDFIDSLGGDPVTIFTGDPGAFKGAALPEGTSVLSAHASEFLLTDPDRLRQVGRRRLIEWMRSGSSLGHLFERAARNLLGLIRPVKVPSTKSNQSIQPINTYLIDKLEYLHETKTLSIIAVFDLFDLPSVMVFAARSGVRVVVR